MTITLNGTTGITTPGETNTGTLSVTGIITASQGVGGTPAFSAYQSSAQTISNATFTKVSFQTEEFDTASAFDNATNYRFLPLIAGYYQVNGVVNIGTISGIELATIYKNGSRFKDGASFQNSASGNSSVVSALIYFNGSTDYIELYCYQTSGVSSNISTGTYATYFQAAMVRAA